MKLRFRMSVEKSEIWNGEYVRLRRINKSSQDERGEFSLQLLQKGI